MFYCENVVDNKILNFTENPDIASELGWTITVEEIEQSYDGFWYVKGFVPDKPVDGKKSEVRAVRNSYLEQYVDPKQLVLVWDSLTEEKKAQYAGYRQYLLDYPESSETWYEQNPMTFDEWIRAE